MVVQLEREAEEQASGGRALRRAIAGMTRETAPSKYDALDELMGDRECLEKRLRACELKIEELLARTRL